MSLRAPFLVAVAALATIACRDYEDLHLDLRPDAVAEADLARADAGADLSNVICASTALQFDGGVDAATASAESFGAESHIPLHGNAATGAATVPVSVVLAGDVTGDGVIDLVTLASSPLFPQAELTILPGAQSAGRRLFVAEQLVRQTSLATTLGLGDFDGDGQSELILGTDALFANENSLRIARWDATKSKLVDLLSLPAPARPRSLAAADLDRDGAMDLIVGFNAFDGTTFGAQPDALVRIYWGTPHGLPSIEGYTELTLPLTDPTYLSIADLDGDCLAELIVASGSGPSSDNFFVVQHQSLRGFTLANSTELVASGIVGLRTADLDRDGRDDLVIASLDPNSGERALRALYSRGARKHFNAIDLAVNQAGPPTIGDINRDGLPDVLYWTTDGQLRVALMRPTRSSDLRELTTPDQTIPAAAPIVVEGNVNGLVDVYYPDGLSPDLIFRLGE